MKRSLLVLQIFTIFWLHHALMRRYQALPAFLYFKWWKAGWGLGMRIIWGASLVLTTPQWMFEFVSSFCFSYLTNMIFLLFIPVKTATYSLSAPATRLWNSLPDDYMHPDHLYQENAVFSEVQQWLLLPHNLLHLVPINIVPSVSFLIVEMNGGSSLMPSLCAPPVRNSLVNAVADLEGVRFGG